MRMILTGILAILVLSACTDSGPADVTLPVKQSAVEASDAQVPVVTEAVTTGDVEQKVFLNGTVMPEGQGPNVKVAEISDPRGKINMVTVDVYEPFPEHLSLSFHARTDLDWETSPLAIRGKAMIEGNPEPIGQMQFVWGKGSMENPQDFSVDPMPALATVPDSVLVFIRADAVLLPKGTDIKTVDPATASGPEDSMTILMSNPIRINFHKAPAPVAPGQ